MSGSNAVPMIQVLPDFRRARSAEWCYSNHRGKYVALLLCEELVEGRWEPFCAEIGCDGVFYGSPIHLDPLRWVFPSRSH
jgi:hypothetical protein